LRWRIPRESMTRFRKYIVKCTSCIH
jgi:hypothetical protein